ncbi:MAG TPA: excinuclease ABC subunit UvrC [Gemmatimonadaceae bacterium]|nr:excinuclease ABC subunit UvrC [Gemmatimonadaceae bacterium]
MSLPESVLERVNHLPESPGVYLWKGADGEVLYVGKAKRLRARVRSYLGSDRQHSPKTFVLMRQVADLETIVVPSESAALMLESNLIKEHRPKYNVVLRDDKSYPYIKVTVQERFPRVLVTRRVVDDGARYYGPYTEVGAMRRALDVVRRSFTVRSCAFDLPRQRPDRPCLDYYIKRCKAPCVGLQAEADYRAMIDEVVEFLEGHPREVVRRVRERMEAASAALDFERAAELRDVLARLGHMEEPSVVLEVGGGDRDVLGFARDGDVACMALLRIRGGKLLAREHQFLEHVQDETDGAVLAAYLVGAYLPLEDKASDLLLPFPSDEPELTALALAPVRVTVPQRGPRREVVALAEQNARHLLEESLLEGDETVERAGDPVYELQRQLGLQKLPRTLVCFDISHAQGTDTVASCVWFQNGRPRRSEYRKFKVKTVEGIDDFASMHEVVSRYFTRRRDEGKPLPDLVVIDGGKGQLGAAHAALSALGLGEMPMISLAKREEEIFMVGRSESFRLPRRSPALRMLQQARDEAHRFAITFQRSQRKVRTVTSALLGIPGVGDARRRQLLQAFGSLQGVRDATPEAIAALPGFSAESAARILAILRANSPTAPSTVPSDVVPSTEESQ